MSGNIINAAFCGTSYITTRPAWLIDYGMVLKLSGIELPEVYEVDFANSKNETATRVLGGPDGVTIPDQYFLAPHAQQIFAWLYLHTGEDDGYTKIQVTIPINKRPDVTDDPPTPEEHSIIEQAIAALNIGVERAETAAENAEEAVEHYPKIVDGFWYVWIGGQWVDTGVQAEGEDGAPGPQGPKGDKLTYDDLTPADKADLIQGPIAEAQTAAVAAVNQAGTTQVSAVNQAGTAQVDNVNTAGAAQVQAVEDKGEEVLESIPADYSDLSAEVDDLKSAFESYKFDELFSELQISEAQNLYNKDTAVDGYIAANGSESESTTYCHSAKIPVEVGKTYSFWTLNNGAVVSVNARFLCAYDSTETAVSGAGSNSPISAYTVPDGITAIVTSFEIVRKHLFMVVEGTVQPAGLLPYNVEHYVASQSFISEAVSAILRGNEQLKISVPSATANTEYKLAEHLDNKKNCEYSFFGKFASFSSIEIGHGKTESGANYLVIDGTNITSYRPDGTEYAHYAHGLSNTDFIDFINVSIKVADTHSQRAIVTIITNGGSATVGNVIFFGCNGAIYFTCGQATTEVDFGYSVMDLRKDVYVFGDSYISLADDKRWPNYAILNNDNNMLLSGFPGARVEEEYPSVEKILSMGTPKYLCWFNGMNNPDGASGIDSAWVVITSQVVSTCKAKGIVPILATIPNTPTQRNTYKNAWVKASGERYVDFAKAVGAEDAGSTWYTGMLSSDNVHPTAEGAKALWLQMRMDVPEIMQPITI